jgi:hypothetical protein
MLPKQRPGLAVLESNRRMRSALERELERLLPGTDKYDAARTRYEIYSCTFKYMEELATQFIERGGLLEQLAMDCEKIESTYSLEYRQEKGRFERKLKRPGWVGFVKMAVLPAVFSAIYGLLAATGALGLFAGIAESPVWGKVIGGAISAVGAGLSKFGADSIGDLLADRRKKAVGERERGALAGILREKGQALLGIPDRLLELKIAISDLAVLEYLRQAALKGIMLSGKFSDAEAIAWEMGRKAVEVRERQGFELRLPQEVKEIVNGLLAPAHPSGFAAAVEFLERGVDRMLGRLLHSGRQLPVPGQPRAGGHFCAHSLS